MRKQPTDQVSTFLRESFSNLTSKADGSRVLTARYDEMGYYYNANGEPSEPPQKLQGKNRGFATSGYEQQQAPRYQGHGGRHQGGGGYRDRDDGYQKEDYRGYGGGGRRNYGDGGRDRRRHYNDDFDDDPINQEFGGCDEDDYYLDKHKSSKEDEEKLERAFKFESSRKVT